MTLTTTESSVSLDRKSLGKPDRFTTVSKAFFEKLAKNRGLLIVLAGAVVLGAVALGWMAQQRTQRLTAGADALYEARQLRDKELAAVVDSLPLPPAQKAAAKETPEQAAARESSRKGMAAELARFAKLDVDAKFPGALAAYQKIVAQHPGTFAGTQASLGIGDLYANHGSPEKALPHYEAALKSAPSPFFRMLSGYALANAQVDSGRLDEALVSADRAVSTGEGALKGELLLLMARVHEQKKDPASARRVYERVQKELTGSEFAEIAGRRLALLPQQ